MPKSGIYLVRYRREEESRARTAFLGGREIRSRGGDLAQAVPVARLAGKQWFCAIGGPAPGSLEHRALSTEAILRMLGEGCRIEVIRGPFSTHAEADRALELYWEAMRSGG
ncbi:MAG: hypothetical protein ACE5JG_09105 [Planctomycetota bacterium]